MKRIICIVGLAAACSGAMAVSPRVPSIEQTDPSKVRIMSNLHHSLGRPVMSSDENYLFSCGGSELAVWDVRSGRVITTFTIPGLERIEAHRTNPAWIILHRRRKTLLEPEPRMVFDWMKGVIVGQQDKSEVPRHLTVDPLRQARDAAAEVRYKPRHYGMLPMQIWGVDVSTSDSLILTGGMRPVVYDIKNLRPYAHLPYLETLMGIDTTLNYNDFAFLPPRKDAQSLSVFFNRYFFDTQFAHGDTIRMGSMGGYFSEWTPGGQILSVEGVPRYSDIVFDAVSVPGADLVGTLAGLFLKDSKGWTWLGQGRREGLPDVLMPSRISRPFGRVGAELVVVGLSNQKDYQVHLLDIHSGETKCMTDSREWGDLIDIDIFPDEKGGLAVNGHDAALLDWSDGKTIRIKPLHLDLGNDLFVDACRVLPDGRLLFGTGAGSLILTDRKGNIQSRMSSGAGSVHVFDTDSKGERLYAMHINNAISVWDLKDMRQLATLFYFTPDGVMAVTPDHYYTMPPALNEFVHFSKDNRVYSLEQFDMRNNRPDIVMERLGGNPAQIELLRNAWLKRLRRNGLTPEMLADDYHAPEVEIVDLERLPRTTKSTSVSFVVSAVDSREMIKSLEIAVNGVPVVKEENLALPAGKEHQRSYDIELARGANNITVFVRNGRGTASRKAEYRVDCEAVPQGRTLYAVCIGVSDYSDAGYSLNYAAKDATDVARFLSENCVELDEVKTLVLTDSDFSRASLEKIRKFISPARRDDAVLLFYAGHGVVDGALDYYLAPHDMDFRNPAGKGIAMDSLTGILDGIDPLKRYVIVDACHSGRIDKEDFIAANVATLPAGEGGVVFRGAETLKFKSKEMESVNQLISSFFSDSDNASGAMIASSASGMEVAVESPEWQNGIFTYHLIRGLEKNGSRIAADADYNGRATMEELLRYAVEMVPRTTEGAQNPTLRTLESSSRPLVINKTK